MKIILVLFITFLALNAKRFSQADLNLRKYNGGYIDGVAVYEIEVGGYKAPLCRFAISRDGRYFYFSRLRSNCRRFTNSRGIPVVCNYNKSVCKTRYEIRDFINNGYYQYQIDPGFDCSKARTYVEKRMCANEELARLNRKLNSVYKTTYNLLKPSYSLLSELKTSEKKWIKIRDIACKNEPDSCISNMLRERIDTLQNLNDAIYKKLGE